MDTPQNFRIEVEKASVLKPVLNAAQRGISNGIVTVGTDGLKIEGTDGANVTATTIEVSPDTFDVFDGDTGQFQTDMESWWDAIRNARKSDPVTIYTEPHEDDSFTRMPGVGVNDKRVLKDKGFEEPADLQGVTDPETLVGEVDYKSHSTTKTAEIDLETAREILGNVSAPIIRFESDGEDLLDRDKDRHYPRVRYNTLDMGVPDLEFGATATVNGKDFSKAFRGVSMASDQVFFAATGDTLVMHGEGDTDEVYATPPADVDGPDSGGLYSTDYVNDLRLSLDRKASTQLTLDLPGLDADEDEDQVLPLRARYEIGGGDDGTATVETYISPRIGTDESEWTRRGRVEELHPDRHTAFEDIRLEATAPGGKVKAWFSILGGMADECKLEVGTDGLSTGFVDPANVGMQEVDVPASEWDEYSRARVAGRLRKQDGIVGMPTGRVQDYLKVYNKTDDVTFVVDRHATLGIRGEYFTASIPSINPDSVRMQPDLPNLELPGQTTVAADVFEDALDDVDEIADHWALLIYDGDLYVGGDGDIDEVFKRVESEGIGYAGSLFSMDYMGDYLDALPRNYDGNLTMTAGREFPVHIGHHVKGAACRFMLAPRIQNEREKNGVVLGELASEAGLNLDRIKDADAVFNLGDGEVEMTDEPEPVEDADAEEGGDTYDPVEEWAEEVATRWEDKREAIQEVHDRDKYGGQYAIAPSDVDPSQGPSRRYYESDGHWIHRDDVTDPSTEETWEEMMAEIYDPTQEFEDQADADVDAAEDQGVYDPTDEFDELEEPDEFPVAFEGRRKTIDAIDAKDRLDDVQTFNTLEDMTNAVREISLARRDGRTYMSPPTKTIERIESVYNDLPEEAQKAYLNDHVLHRRINAARKAFNRWMGKKKREQQIPSSMEAGPSNYPAKKARKTSRYAREGYEELQERIDKIRAGAKGAKQRALNAIGSSIAERNAKKAATKAEKMKARLSKGDIVSHRNVHYGRVLWGVKRLNDKSVRLRRPHQSAGQPKPMSDDVYPEFDHTTVDYDSRWLEPLDREDFDSLDPDEIEADVAPEILEGYKSAIRYLMGEEWVDANLDLDAIEEHEEDEDPISYRETEDGAYSWRIDLPDGGPEGHPNTEAAGVIAEPTTMGEWTVTLSALDSDYQKLDEGFLDPGSRVLATYESEEKAKANAEHTAERLADGEYGEYMEIGDDKVKQYAQKAAEHRGATLLDGPPEVGQYLALTFMDGGGFNGAVTRVTNDTAFLRTAEGQPPVAFDYKDDNLRDPRKGTTDGVKIVEVLNEDAEDLEDPDAIGGGYDAPGEDDLSDAIAAEGINRVTANHLADEYDSLGDVSKAVENADDVTDLKGVGEGSKEEVLDVFGTTDLPPEIDPDQYDGEYKNQRMENAHYWAAQLLGWMKDGPNAGLRGTYYVDIIGGRPVLVMDGDEWTHESNVEAIRDAMRDHGFPSPLQIRELDDEWRLWIKEPTDDRLPTDWHPDGWRSFEATGGDGGDPDARFATDQLEWDTPNPNEGTESMDYDPKNPAKNENKELAAKLRSKGINPVVASNLARRYDTFEEVRNAVEGSSSADDIRGVNKTYDDVVAAFGGQVAADGGQDDDTLTYSLWDKEEDTTEKVEVPRELNGWEWENDLKKGYATWVDPDDSDRWIGFTKSGGSTYMALIRDPKRGAETERTFSTIEEAADEARYMMAQNPVEVPYPIEPDGGEEKSEHQKAVEAARKADPDGDLPGPALKALKKAWSGYKSAAKEGHEAAEEVEEWEEARPDAAEFAAIINDIREAYGQPPIDFEGVDGIPEVDELGGPITKHDPNVSISFDWTADPYDPMEDL